jgi:predicted amidophosphoribosyltransferase
MGATTSIARLLTPPLCVTCAAPCPAQAVLCAVCEANLRRCDPLIGNPPAHVDLVWSCTRHDGIARDLVSALKFRRMTVTAGPIAERIAALAPAEALSGTLVPVPPAPLRLRWRGFDSAAEIAVELSRLSGLPISECLRRRGSDRQVGRARSERIALPPRVRACRRPPARVALVDDVLTTGATLAACAEALRRAGAETVSAVTFARRL